MSAPETARYRLGCLLVLGLALVVRAVTLGSSLPYLGYIDEGHVLHRVTTLLGAHTWDPGWYSYPSLTPYLITAALLTASPIYSLVHGHPLAADLSGAAEFYDFVTPPEVIAIGRIVVLLFALGTVALGMVLARRLGGRRAGLAAGVLLAFCPALVQRSSVVNVDTVASFFVVAALVASERLSRALESGGGGGRAWIGAFLAGALAGLAAAAKYPAGAVAVAPVAIILLAARPPARALRLLAGAGLGAVIAAVAGMPAFALRTRAVLGALREQARLYSDSTLFTTEGPGPSLVAQAFYRYELGVLLPGLIVAAGLAILMQRETRRTAASWWAFSLVLLAPLLLHPFQPFRNALGLVTPGIVAVSVSLGLLSRRLAGRQKTVLAAVVAAIVLSFAPGLKKTFEVRGARDSRKTLVDWLSTQAREQRVLVVRELAILPRELERSGCSVRVVSWRDVRALAEAGGFDLLVGGRFDTAGSVPAASASEIGAVGAYEKWLSGLEELTRVGSAPTPSRPNYWRTNEELLVVTRIPRTGAAPRANPS